MSLILVPVFNGGHDPEVVAMWPMDTFSWWYLTHAKRIKAQNEAEREARRNSKRR